MSILALDLGTRTGVAYGDAGSGPALETWDLPAGGGADVGPIMDEFERRLSAALAERAVSLLVFEAPYVGPKILANMHTARRLIGLPALCEMIAHRADLEVAECNIMTVKKEFAGHGRAEKRDMIEAARRRGFEAQNDHEADAAGCWWYAVLCRFPEHAAQFEPMFARGAR